MSRSRRLLTVSALLGVALGVAGVALALALIAVALKVLPFLPQSLADSDAGPDPA